MLGLHPASPSAPPPGTAGSMQIGLEVKRPLEAAKAELEKRGVAFPGAIVDDGAVRLLHFADADGHPLYLCEVK